MRKSDRRKATLPGGVWPGAGKGLYQGSPDTAARHSAATEVRRQGVPLDVFQKLRGERESRSTEVQAELLDRAPVEAAPIQPAWHPFN